ncbi:carcinine transporter isoform X3 [Parasteatoda tepidariorum]|uniref:carcinine transporter isoform X4 n=1 Tax=Parasteatoda tepidariorum TaxID=114398 RepID=UPI001C7265D1|nr:carcinine transporter [Parasteatoda tepidariorum]
MPSSKKEPEFEDLLEEIGDFGKYQKRLLIVFLIPSALVLPWFSMNIIFMVFTPEHWCYVPEVVNSNLSHEVQRSIIVPRGNSSCFKYDVNYTELFTSGSLQIKNDTPIISCRSWQYDTTYFEETAASKWNMVCDHSHYSSLVMTLTNVGSIIGTPFYGTLSDKIGRKPVFFIVILVTAITAISSVLMTNFWTFLILRTINGSLMPSVFQLPYIILLEIVGLSQRTKMNGIANASWTIGLCFLAPIAYFTRHWVTFGLATSSVSILMFLYWKFLPESPRWLISQERYKEATRAISRIAETNGKTIEPVELRMKIQKLGEKVKKEKLESANNTFLDLFRFPNLRKKFLIISFCWVADIFAYYGLQINVSNLGGDPFFNFFFLALVEIPGLICSWYFMEKWGRRWCSVSALALTGSACLLVALVPGAPVLAVVCSLIGKFGASASFMAVYQQSSELYPTTIRAIGMGMSGTFAAVANIIVPYIVFLAFIEKYIPFLIIGLVCVLAAVSATFLPETLNEVLPQTINDAEAFGKGQQFLSCSSKRRSSVISNEDEKSPHLLKDTSNDENSWRKISLS